MTTLVVVGESRLIGPRLINLLPAFSWAAQLKIAAALPFYGTLSRYAGKPCPAFPQPAAKRLTKPLKKRFAAEGSALDGCAQTRCDTLRLSSVTSGAAFEPSSRLM